jgi:hypothetical protein
LYFHPREVPRRRATRAPGLASRAALTVPISRGDDAVLNGVGPLVGDCQDHSFGRLLGARSGRLDAYLADSHAPLEEPLTDENIRDPIQGMAFRF